MFILELYNIKKFDGVTHGEICALGVFMENLKPKNRKIKIIEKF